MHRRGKRRQETHLLLKLRQGITWRVPARGSPGEHHSLGRQGVNGGARPQRAGCSGCGLRNRVPTGVGRDAGGGEGSGGTAHPSARFLVHCVDAGVVGD